MKTLQVRYPPLLKGSVALHVAAAAVIATSPKTWPFALSALIADHAVIAGAGLWPRSRLLGPNMLRLSAPETDGGQVALTFDDGPDPEITPKVLEILAKYGVAATFFVIGHRAADHPELVREIAAAGHSIGNHSWRHSPAFFFAAGKNLASELDRTQTFLHTITGSSPSLFRAPAGIRSPLLQPMLADRGLELVSWTRRGLDTIDSQPDRILRRLLRKLRPSDILLLHDGGCARSRRGVPVVLEVLPDLLGAIETAGLQAVPIDRRE